MPIYTYKGLTDEQKEAMVSRGMKAAQPKTPIKDTRNVVAYEACKAIREKEMEARREELVEQAAAMDAVYTYEDYVFKKEDPVDVDKDDKVLIARLDVKVKLGEFLKGKPKAAPAKPAPVQARE